MRTAILLFSVFLILTCAGCNDDSEKFSGVSKLIAQRHQARLDHAGQEAAQQAAQAGGKDSVGKPSPGAAGENTGKPSDTRYALEELYQKEVEIIDSSSGTSLAKGLATVDKHGQIIKIKIQR